MTQPGETSTYRRRDVVMTAAGRAFATVVYVFTTLWWMGAMVFGSLLFCEGGNCSTTRCTTWT